MQVSNEQQEVEALNHQAMKDIQKLMPGLGNGTTFGRDLETAGFRLFGNKFAGVFPSDRVPKSLLRSNQKRLAIINLDRSDQPGSHWVGLAVTEPEFRKQSKLILYDSFGRPAKKIFPENVSAGRSGQLAWEGSGRRIISTDPDAEQEEHETNCGQRSLAWLKIFNEHGPDVAMLL